MSHLPPLITDLALLLVTAGVVTLLFRRLRQPLVLGYIVAGCMVSPFVSDGIKVWADIGVMFLLFALGLDFSFKRILKMGLAPVIAALTIVAAMLTVGYTMAKAVGWPQMDGLFLAGMLAMSSTTIIYKAFDDLGLKQQQFAGLVMSVLILEDILAIVMMVVLAAIADGGSPDGGVMAETVLSIAFFLVLWFVVGMYVIPTFLRTTRRLMNDETLLIVALGLCCGMAVLSTEVGFSPAFGAFVMGSILAETVEARKIERVVAPVKDLFGAVFFVSVGMLVDFHVIVSQWPAVLVLTLAILAGQSVFGTFGFMLAGRPLKTAIRCGFSMAQIGEFAFIIASLGLALGVISQYVYPVVVAVSVITTFLTPYMIRSAVPVYGQIERRLPRKWIARINRISDIAPSGGGHEGRWATLLRPMATGTLIYCTLAVAVLALMLTFVRPLLLPLLPDTWEGIALALLTVALMAPFLRAVVMKKNHSDAFRALWAEGRNRPPLVFTIIVRAAIAIALVDYAIAAATPLTPLTAAPIAAVAVTLMAMSQRLKHSSIGLERRFIANMQSRDTAARAAGIQRPLFEGRLLDRDLHIATFEVPHNSTWAGQTLKQLNLAQRFGVHVSSIVRGHVKLNIPSGHDTVFPLDQLYVIGTDDQLARLHTALHDEQHPEPVDIERHDMRLRRLAITADGALTGRTLGQSGLRERYNCMLVGLERDDESLTPPGAAHRFQQHEILWIVGEPDDVARLEKEI